MFNTGEKVYCKSMDRNLIIAHNEGDHAYCCIDISYEKLGSKVFDSFILSDHDLDPGWKEKDIHNENKRYEIVLMEKEAIDGLDKYSIINLFNMLSSKDAYPIELEAKEHECSAMGFISVKAAESLNYDYESSGLHDYIASILDDMNNESLNCEYKFKEISIYLSR